MKKILGAGLSAICLLSLAGSFVHPYGPVKHQSSNEPLLSGATNAIAIREVMARSCGNCHSERTEWPWYSYVAPLSWLVEKDVVTGRSHMNLSRWSSYPLEQQIELLTQLGVEVRNRRMPLPNYLRIHPDARLSDDEVNQLYLWSRNERRRLRNLAASRPTATD